MTEKKERCTRFDELGAENAKLRAQVREERDRIIKLIEDEQGFLSAEDKRLLVERIRTS